jgi:hypothetical protein
MALTPDEKRELNELIGRMMLGFPVSADEEKRYADLYARDVPKAPVPLDSGQNPAGY